MTLDARQDSSLTTDVHLDQRWTDQLTLELVSPSGGDVTGAGAVALSSVSTTITSATQEVVTLADATDVEPGVELVVTSKGVASQVRVTSVDGLAVSISPPLTLTPASGDTVVGVTATVSIPATATAELGVGYQILLTDDSTGVDDLEYREQYNVQRRVFSGAYTVKDVRAMYYQHWPSSVPSDVELQQLVDDAVEEVRGDFYASGRYPTIYINPVTFRSITESVVRRLIAIRFGLFPGDVDDRDTYLDRLETERVRSVGRTIRSIQAVDENNDGAVDEPTVRIFSVELSR